MGRWNSKTKEERGKMKNEKVKVENEEIKESKITEELENESAQEKKNSLNRRHFLGKAAIGGAAAAGFLALPSLLTRGGSGLAQTTQPPPPGPITRCPTGCEIVPYANGKERADIAFKKRVSAANYQIPDMTFASHPCNEDQETYRGRNFIGNFTKGLKRANGPDGDVFGEVDPNVYCALLRAFKSGNPADFESRAIILGFDNSCGRSFSSAESRLSASAFRPNQQRRLESPQAGLNFDTEGKDYYQLINRPNQLLPVNTLPEAFPPAPTIQGKIEFTEIVENYWQAVTRDIPFINYSGNTLIAQASADLTNFSQWYSGPLDFSTRIPKVTPQLYSRGITPGDAKGPYLSQFFLRDVPYGRQPIDAKIVSPVNTPVNNYMTTESDWLEIQKGRTPSTNTVIDNSMRRYIRSGRDLAEYVHIDAIYQTYLNAALLLATTMDAGGLEAPLDPANPYPSFCKQNNFVEFGISQLLTLIGEVSVRAHKAIWYQKWVVHRRLRPEAFGALVHFRITQGRYDDVVDKTCIDMTSVLKKVFKLNYEQSYLLPQAFPEGSPMHPSYGAGHATLAGACVTLLKAWFDSEKSFIFNDYGEVIRQIFVPNEDGTALVDITPQVIRDFGDVTFADELNKLAANISIGRNIAGVHWRSDYTESILLGEQVAIQLLEEYGYTYNENFKGFSFRGFLGDWFDYIGKNR